MTIQQLPLPVPTRLDPVGFPEAADNLMGALPTLVDEINAEVVNINTKASEVEADADAAFLARTAAELAQSAAEAASAASKWVSGTTYTEGVVVWSPADFASYRRKSTGAGTTDPSADSASWAKLGASAALNGSQTLTTSTTLTASSPTVNLLAFTAHGGSVTMPNAITMTAGGCKFILDNSAGQFPVGVLNGAGQVMGQVLPGDSIQLHLTSAATAAGVWRHSGNLDPVWITNEIGLSLTRPNSTATIFSIDATRCLIVWSDTNNHPRCRIVTWTSPTATPTVSAEILIAASVVAISEVVALGTGRAILRTNLSTYTVLDTTTGAVGSLTSVSFTAGSGHRLQVLDSQYAVVLLLDATNYVTRARCLDCGASGTTITVGAEANSAARSGSGGAAFFGNGTTQAVSSTAIGVIGFDFQGGSGINYWAYSLTRTSGTTLSWSANAGNPPSARTADSTQNTSELHPLSASTALLWYWSNTTVRYAVITFASGSATWGTSVASNACTSTANVTAFAASPDRTRFVAAQCAPSGACNVEAITVSGTTVTVGASTSFSSETAASTAGIALLAVTNEGRGVVFWSGQARSSGPSEKIRLFTLSGTAFTFGPEGSSVSSGRLGSLDATFSVTAVQQYSRNNLFRINASTSGSYGYSAYRQILFQVAADASMDVIVEVNAIGGFGFSARVGSDNLLLADFANQTSTHAERVWVNAATKKTIRARVPAYKLGSQMHNGQPAWSNSQRLTGLGLLSHYILPGSNALLQTHRIAEV